MAGSSLPARTHRELFLRELQGTAQAISSLIGANADQIRIEVTLGLFWFSVAIQSVRKRLDGVPSAPPFYLSMI